MLEPAVPQGYLLGSEALGNLLADYITTFDAALKLFFAEQEPLSRATRGKSERLYRDYTERQGVAV